MGSMLCKIYGVIDISAGFAIMFGTDLPDPIKLIFMIIFLFKGIPSLFA